ncbi:MAG: exonuclease domain-containing protein, partial [Planctomycetota bacterium]
LLMPISLMDQLADVPVAVVDVETTGSSAFYGDRVTEIGIAVWRGGEVVETYQQLVDPCRRINPGVVALTGISDAMVAGQPRFAEIADEVNRLMRGAVVVGHNVRFDLSFLDNEYVLAGRCIEEQWGTSTVLDTVRIARRRFGRGGNGLQRLAVRFGIDVDTAHRALADALTTGQVLGHLLGPVGGWGLPLVDVLALQGGPMELSKQSARRETEDVVSTLPLELAEALRQRAAVRMEYLDARHRRTERVIEPMDVKRSQRNPEDDTLVCYCHLRQEMRTFKLARIVSVTRVSEV